jgi:hypothetical protein
VLRLSRLECSTSASLLDERSSPRLPYRTGRRIGPRPMASTIPSPTAPDPPRSGRAAPVVGADPHLIGANTRPIRPPQPIAPDREERSLS